MMRPSKFFKITYDNVVPQMIASTEDGTLTSLAGVGGEIANKNLFSKGFTRYASVNEFLESSSGPFKVAEFIILDMALMGLDIAIVLSSLAEALYFAVTLNPEFFSTVGMAVLHTLDFVKQTLTVAGSIVGLALNSLMTLAGILLRTVSTGLATAADAVCDFSSDELNTYDSETNLQLNSI